VGGFLNKEKKLPFSERIRKLAACGSNVANFIEIIFRNSSRICK